jgi:coenzyme F420-reducing hydrogenase alpha subunit
VLDTQVEHGACAVSHTLLSYYLSLLTFYFPDVSMAILICFMFKESLNKSFDKLRTNGKCLIPLVVSLSNHERNQLVQGFLKYREG